MAKTPEQIAFETKVTKRLVAMQSNMEKTLNDKSKGIYKALEELDKYSKSNNTITDVEKFKSDMWTKISEEWSKSLSTQISASLSIDLTELLADIRFSYNEFDPNS